MGRRIFNMLAVMSLVMTCGVVVLCIRGRAIHLDQITFQSRVWPSDRFHWNVTLQSRPSYLTFWFSRSYDQWSVEPGLHYYCSRNWGSLSEYVDDPRERPWPIPIKWWRSVGMISNQTFPETASPYVIWHASASYALLLVLSLVAPLVWLRRAYVRRRVRRLNLCPTCGYDLRATPNRCPECGAVRAGS